MCFSLTLLSFRIVMDTSWKNGVSWDAVIPCEAIGKYKVLPEAYRTCAKFLQLDPSECCMVARHNFDFNTAKACGYQTAFVRRPNEWVRKDLPIRSPTPGRTSSPQASPSLRINSEHDGGCRVCRASRRIGPPFSR
jgi:2-haloacid dehalogenase